MGQLELLCLRLYLFEASAGVRGFCISVCAEVCFLSGAEIKVPSGEMCHLGLWSCYKIGAEYELMQ